MIDRNKLLPNYTMAKLFWSLKGELVHDCLTKVMENRIFKWNKFQLQSLRNYLPLSMMKLECDRGGHSHKDIIKRFPLARLIFIILQSRMISMSKENVNFFFKDDLLNRGQHPEPAIRISVTSRRASVNFANLIIRENNCIY